MTQGHKEQVVGSRLREFYHAADPAVREVIEKGAFYLAMTLKNCLVMLNLSTVVVYGDLFLTPSIGSVSAVFWMFSVAGEGFV